MTTRVDPLYNPNCLFCGGALWATVEMVNTGVPLGVDGYRPDEGDQESVEITEVTCTKCGRDDIHPGHYFDHGPDGEPCDCVEATVNPEG